MQRLLASPVKCRLELARCLLDCATGAEPLALPACDADGPALGRLAQLCGERAGLTGEERALLACGGAVATGAGCLAVAALDALLPAATVAAALSCEALQADLRSLERETDAAGGRGQVALELRGLLEGSKTLGGPKGGLAFQGCSAGVPQLHGVVKEALAAASKAVKLELDAPLPAPGRSSAGLRCKHLPSAALPAALLGLAQGTLGATGAALARTELVLRKLAGATAAAAREAAGAFAEARSLAEEVQACAQAECETAAGLLAAANAAGGAAPGASVGLAALAAAEALQRALAVEGLAAAALVRATEGPVKAPAAAAPAAEAGAPPADPRAAAKAAKAAKKAAKKKKGGGGGGLGKGTQQFRNFVERAAAGGAAAAGANAEADLTPDASLRELAGAEADGEGDGAALAAGWLEAAAGALAWTSPGLQKHLAALKRTIDANQPRRKPKIAKGARDFLPEQMAIREQAFAKIVGVFKRHGAVAIDTPVFELRKTLMGKYGEDSKLIYDLADQGGEALSLRYDLTVPFARFVALHGSGNIKRYHIARVYRRDQPQMARGRFREFFQCDFDIAGTYAAMVPDAEVLKVLAEILEELAIGDYVIKLNHRAVLDGMMEVCGVPPQKFRPICSAIDKLDKEPWAEVRREMVEDKGLAAEAADRIAEFVVLKGSTREMVAQLSSRATPLLEKLADHPQAAAALEHLTVLADFLEAMGASDRISFDLSLARGLDYYTGVIYEAVMVGGNVGSVAAGGRYDGLVGMFSGKDVPAVGVSIGIERVMAIMEAQVRARAEAAGQAIRATETQVLVASIGSGLQGKRMEICSRIWAAGLKAEFGFKPNPKMGDQLTYALEQGIPFMVLFGEDELKEAKVKIKDMAAKEETLVDLARVVEELQARLPGAGARVVAA